MAAKRRVDMALLAILDDIVDSDSDDDDIQKFAFLSATAAACIRETRHKVSEYVEKVVPLYTYDQFRTFFRISPTTFETLFYEFSQLPELQRRPLDNGGRPEIDLQKQIMFTLWYLGSLETVRSIADRFNVSESTFIVRHRQILTQLCRMSERFVHWPAEQEYQQIVQRFQRKRGFPNVLGAVDGKHIKIQAPVERANDYYNRKGYHSVIVQAVCREDKRFTDIYVGWPGKVHDARVFRNSPLHNWAPRRLAELHLLGDGAYPIKSWILTPFRDNGHLTAQQRRYNNYHSSTRIAIEHAFGMVKGRFRRLQFIAARNIENIIPIIIACTVLHNICILGDDRLEDYFEEDAAHVIDNPDHADPRQQNDVAGIQKRIAIMEQLH